MISKLIPWISPSDFYLLEQLIERVEMLPVEFLESLFIGSLPLYEQLSLPCRMSYMSNIIPTCHLSL